MMFIPHYNERLGRTIDALARLTTQPYACTMTRSINCHCLLVPDYLSLPPSFSFCDGFLPQANCALTNALPMSPSKLFRIHFGVHPADGSVPGSNLQNPKDL